MKVGIDSYCYHRFLGDVYPEQQPPATLLTMERVIDRAHELGCEGISLESCFFPSFDAGYLADVRARLEAALEPAVGTADFVIIDTPGSDTHLSRLAHTWADTLLTPLNDSFIDLDLLARVDPDTLRIVRPSIYAEAVWKQRQLRAVGGGRPVDWVVMRNRLSSLAARNKRDMGTVIEALARRIGFRVTTGLSERVIYKELFLSGLTLLDLKRGGTGPSLTLSHVAARQEVRDLVAALNLPPAVASEPEAAPATEISRPVLPPAG